MRLPSLGLIVALALALVLDGARAQAPGPAGGPSVPTSVLPDGWPQIVGSLALGFFAVCHAWITSAAGTERRRAERAETELREKEKELEAVEKELKTTRKECDRLTKWAYAKGYQSGVDIPKRGDRP